MPTIKTTLKGFVALALLALLFQKIDLSTFLAQILRANIVLVVISAAMAFLGIYVSILKWNLFLNYFGIFTNKLKLYSLYCISSFFNNFLPSTVGGDSYRFIYLRNKDKAASKRIASSIVMERFTGFLSLYLVNIFVAPFFYKEIMTHRGLLLIESIILASFLLLVTLFFCFKRINLENKILLKIKLLQKLISFIRSLYDVKDRKLIVITILYSMVFAALTAIARNIVFFAFGQDVSFLYILFTSTIIQIIGILPISLNSIGVSEGLSVFMYTLIGISPELSLAVALIGRVNQLVTSSIGGLFYFFNEKIKDTV